MGGGDAASEADADGREIAVTFHPQAWVDTVGEAHEWDRRQLVPAEDREPVTYAVPWDEGTGPDGDPLEDESYEANLLAEHPAAPGWVNEWDGPYRITTEAAGE